MRTTLRGLIQRPGWTAAVIVTLALGIGANTALFNYLRIFFWDPLDAPESHRLVWVRGGTPERPNGQIPYSDWLEYHEHNEVLSPMAGSRVSAASIRSDDTEIFPADAATIFAWGNLVTGDFFPLFAARPTIGRLIQPADDRPGAPPVIVLSHLFWNRHFNANPDILGRTLELEGRFRFTIVGVAPKGFQGFGVPGAFYVPFASSFELAFGFRSRERIAVHTVGRLRPDITREQAEIALTAVARGLDERRPLSDRRVVSLSKIDTWHDGDSRLAVPARILAVVVVCFFLLTCANVANLFLAQALARRRDMAVRAALGANRWHLIRQLASESLVLALAGAALGLMPAYAGLKVLESHLRSVPVGFGNWAEEAYNLAIDERTLFFGVGAAVIAALLFGLAPALRTLRIDLVTPLKSESAGSVGGRKQWSRQTLVTVQVALSVVLLLGAGLMVRTLTGIRDVDPGFETQNLLLAAIYFPQQNASNDSGTEVAPGQENPPQMTRYRELLERLRALPGVRAATVAQRAPLYHGAVPMSVNLPGHDGEVKIDQSVVGPHYFETLDIPLLSGRGFDGRDRQDTTPVTVVNETLARLLVSDSDVSGSDVSDREGKPSGVGSALGRRIVLQQGGPGEKGLELEVVGIVADSYYQSLKQPPEALFYVTYEQIFRRRLTFMLRAGGSMAETAVGVRSALRDSYPELSVIDLVPFSEQIRRSLFGEKINAEVAGSVAVLGLLLAMIGVASVNAYSVRQRVREVGIRMALGATSGDVSRLVLSDALRWVGAGLAIGWLAALASGRILESMLYGVGAHDPLTFAAVPLLLVACAIAATWLPAQRATRVDPAKVLRSE